MNTAGMRNYGTQADILAQICIQNVPGVIFQKIIWGIGVF
jgi:hypothetical protein